MSTYMHLSVFWNKGKIMYIHSSLIKTTIKYCYSVCSQVNQVNSHWIQINKLYIYSYVSFPVYPKKIINGSFPIAFCSHAEVSSHCVCADQYALTLAWTTSKFWTKQSYYVKPWQASHFTKECSLSDQSLQIIHWSWEDYYSGLTYEQTTWKK